MHNETREVESKIYNGKSKRSKCTGCRDRERKRERERERVKALSGKSNFPKQLVALSRSFLSYILCIIIHTTCKQTCIRLCLCIGVYSIHYLAQVTCYLWFNVNIFLKLCILYTEVLLILSLPLLYVWLLYNTRGRYVL